eukprot:Gb_38956 [translate_table: standard]
MEASMEKTRVEQPLLVQKITIPNDHHHEVGSNNERRRWYRSILYIDVQELKKQSLIALPMTVTHVLQYAINLVSVMFAGHLGEVELAGATLANSFAWFFAYSLLYVLASSSKHFIESLRKHEAILLIEGYPLTDLVERVRWKLQTNRSKN